MTLRIRIDINSRQFERWLDQAARKEVPFARALALTRRPQMLSAW